MGIRVYLHAAPRRVGHGDPAVSLMPAPRRPLHPAEAALVRWLLANAWREGAGTVPTADIAALLVAGRCDCGCPSVEFLVEGLAATATIAAEADGISAEGEAVGVILWARSGRLSGLEVYPLAGDGPVSLPLPSTLRASSRIMAEPDPSADPYE